MATKNIVPRADSEGQLGTAAKKWAKVITDQLTIGTAVVSAAGVALLDDANAAAQLVTLGAAPSATAVVGPASATDNAVVRFDATTGKLVQNSNATLSDAGLLALSGEMNINAGESQYALSLNSSNASGANVSFYESSVIKKSLRCVGSVLQIINAAYDTVLFSFDDSGNEYITANMSALSFTDRTPHFTGDAVAELVKVKGKTDGSIDHATLPTFAHKKVKYKGVDGEKGEEEGRDIGAMVSMLTVAIQQLNDRLLALEKN